MIYRFCHLIPKGTETACEIFGVSGPIFTRIAHNVAKIVPIINPESGFAIFESVAKCQHVEFREKVVKIGPVEPEIALLKVKKKK